MQERMSRQRVQLAWDPTNCLHCFGCTTRCMQQALTVDHERSTLSYDIRKCIRCGNCLRGCPTGALHAETVQVP